MSLKQEVTLSCPACEQDFTAAVWLSVNTNVSPELKEKILDDTLNEISCSHCGFAFVAVAPLLYHDMEKDLMCHVWPGANDAERIEAERQTRDILATQHGNQVSKTSVYVLDSMAELKQIISGLDNAEYADGSHLDFTNSEEWKEIADIIMKPPIAWPLDHTCVCGEQIPIVCFCREPGAPINMTKHEPNVPPDLKVRCWKCWRRLVGFSCVKCNQTYQWSRGVVDHAIMDK